MTPKTWEKSPNNIVIRPNLPYYVSSGLITGLVVPKAPHPIKLTFCAVFAPFLNSLIIIAFVFAPF